MIIFLICLFPALILIAAITGYGKVSERKVRQLENGMTARQIIKKIGKPHSVTTMGDIDLWIYIKSNAHFSIRMKDGIAIGVPRIPDPF